MGRLIISGAGGFLGSNICRYALERNHYTEIVAVTLGSAEMRERFRDASGISIYEAGAVVSGKVKLCHDDLVVNCAYPRNMSGSDVTAGLDYIETVFRKCADGGVKAVINISSQSIYDPQREHAASETDVPVLTDPYAVGKYCMEMLLRNICTDLPYTNVRLASLIGPGFNARVPNKMVKYAMENGSINVEINHQKFGYIDVADATNGLLNLAETDPDKWDSVYNLGSDRSYALTDIAEAVRYQLKAIKGIAVNIVEYQGNAVLNTELDNTRIKSLIGNYQKMDLNKSIGKIIDSF